MLKISYFASIKIILNIHIYIQIYLVSSENKKYIFFLMKKVIHYTLSYLKIDECHFIRRKMDSTIFRNFALHFFFQRRKVLIRWIFLGKDDAYSLYPVIRLYQDRVVFADPNWTPKLKCISVYVFMIIRFRRKTRLICLKRNRVRILACT